VTQDKTAAQNPPQHDCCKGNYCHGKKRGDAGWCHRPPGWGTEHVGIGRCKLHGGSTPNHNTAARQEQARRDVETYGLPRDIEPAVALLEEVHRTAGHVAWLGAKVRGMDEGDLVWGVTEEVDKGSGEFTGTDTTRKAVPNVWLELYHRERKHLVEVSAKAIAAGCSERLVRLQEQQGVMLASVISGALDAHLSRVLGVLGDSGEAEVIRRSWPEWVSEIVPAQIAAVAGGEG